MTIENYFPKIFDLSINPYVWSSSHHALVSLGPYISQELVNMLQKRLAQLW